MPPNFGEGLLPHAITFQGILSSISRVYRSSDEAIRDSRDSARYMRNDPTIMECLEQRQRSTALLNWHLEPEDQKDARQKELCEDLKAIIEQTPRFMQYRENLLHALWYGKYGIQNRYRWKKIRGQMRVAVDRWLPVNGDKIVFRFDDGTGMYDPDQVGIRVGAGFTTGNAVANKWSEERKKKVEPTDYGMAYFLEPWERQMLAIHKHMIEDGDFEEPISAGKIHGLGIRSRIYWTWYQKQESLAWLMEFLERSAFGFEIWYYPWGDDSARKKVEEAAINRIGQGRNIVFMPRPQDESGGMAYGVDKIEANMAGADTLERILKEYFGHQIKRYILGQTLTTEADSTGLGSNLASVHLDTYLQIIRYDATNLEETLTTELVEPLKLFNFPEFRDVQVRFRIDTEAADVEGKLAAWERAWTMGAKLRSQDVMDLIGASKPDSDEDILVNPQVEAARQEIAAQRENQKQQQQQRVAMVQGGLGEGDRNADGGGDNGMGNLPGGFADGADAGQFDPDQLERGVAHEMEHTDDPQVALEIAMDHLAEHPDYYAVLERMEDNDCDDGDDEDNETKDDASVKARDLDVELYAADSNWKESEHPRGQPDNPGEFSRKCSTQYVSADSGKSTETEEFKSWFGNSKVVDTKGNPRVVFHGTSTKPFWEFDSDTESAHGSHGFHFTGTFQIASDYATNGGMLGEGDVYIGKQSKTWSSQKKTVMEGRKSVGAFYLSIQNPIILDAKDDIDGDFTKLNKLVSYFQENPNPRKASKGDVAGDLGEYRLRKKAIRKIIATIVKSKLPVDGIIVKNATWDPGCKIANTQYIAFSPTQIKSAYQNVGSYDSTVPDVRYKKNGETTLDETGGKGEVQAYSAGSFHESLKDDLSQTTADEYAERVAKAAAETDTNPSDEQKAGGNYRKGKCRLHGLEIAIENPAGSVRSGKSSSGEPWSVTMPAHYGYIKQTESEADGDHVDVFLGPDLDSEIVFVIDQLTPAGRFDEHKCMMGWKSADEAKTAYWEAYADGYRGQIGAVVAMTMPQFKAWLKHGDTGHRAANQVERYRKLPDYRESDHPRGQPDNPGEFATKSSGQHGGGGNRVGTAAPSAPGDDQPNGQSDKQPAYRITGNPQPAAKNPSQPSGAGRRGVQASTTASDVKHEVRIDGDTVLYRNSADTNAQWQPLPANVAKWFHGKIRESADRTFAETRRRDEKSEIQKVRQHDAEQKILGGLEYGPIKGNALRRQLKIDPNIFVDAYFALADAGKIIQDPRDGTIYIGKEYPAVSEQEANRGQNRAKRETKKNPFDLAKEFASQLKIVKPQRSPEEIAAAEAAKAKAETEQAARAKESATEWKQAEREEKQRRITDVAEAFDISPDELTEAAKEILEGQREHIELRNAARNDAWKTTGLSMADIKRQENSGRDYSTIQTRGIVFDKAARVLAKEYPGVFGDANDPNADLAAGLWDLLREGKQELPSIYDPEILDEAANYVTSAKRGREPEEEPIPFANAGQVERYTKEHSEGETKVVNGRTYRLNHNSRWERSRNEGEADSSVIIQGNELGKHSLISHEDKKAFRKVVKNYWRNHLKGKPLRNDETGMRIVLSSQGIDEIISHSGDLRRLKLVPAIPKLIKHAALVGESSHHKPEKPRYDYWYYFHAEAVLEGTPIEMTLEVGAANINERWLYTIQDIQEIRKPVPKEGPNEFDLPHNDGPSIPIIGHAPEEVKREKEDYAAVGGDCVPVSVANQPNLAGMFAAAFHAVGL
ncbi:phage portal protein family protein [Trichococcus shcherbakoviae]|uniref:phage portal protein family protein n=1 Tax=Trichococcus shcherbakoviae TaxID=2094020 RepID=UPI002AA6BA43|nr:DUF935 family protein [Trichococcus shcherbakoviae]